jgi:hypothetical protein
MTVDSIYDSSELLNDLLDPSEKDLMTALHKAIDHRDNCKLEQCALCEVFRKHERKRRQEFWGWGRGSRVDEDVSIHALISGEAGETRRFEYTSHHDGLLRIGKTDMRVILLATGKEDGDAATLFDWTTGTSSNPRLENRLATFFAPSPLGSGCTLADLRKGDRLAFSARFREAATLSVNLWGQFRPARKDAP